MAGNDKSELETLLAALAPQRREMRWTGRFLSAMQMTLGLGDDVISVLGSDIIPKRVKWLWPNRVPQGKLTLFVGNPDNGKSMVGTYVTAVTTTGHDWCDETKNTLPASEVFIFASEDDPEDTSVPRLMAAGANLKKVQFTKMISGNPNATENEREMRLDTDIVAIRKALGANPNIRLIIIDPVSNYLGATKMVDEQAVRRVLAPLQSLASETGVAILGIMHLNKKQDLAAIHRIGGAMAFVGVARAVWLFTMDTENPKHFHMLPIKKNIGERVGGLKYEIVTKPVKIEGEDVPEPYVEWLGPSDKSADNMLAPKPVGRPRHARDEGSEWLRGFLSDGPKLSTEVEAQSEAAGFKYRTLERCKDDIGVESVKGVKGDEQWYWKLK